MLSNSSSTTAVMTICPSKLVGRAHRGGAHRGHAGLHVRRSASIDAPLALERVPRRVRHAVHADDVEVPVEHQRPPARASGARDDVRTLRGGVLQIDAKSPILEHRGERFRHRVLAGATGDERRIPRVDAHELARQRDGVAACYRQRSTPCSSTAKDNSSPSGATARRTSSLAPVARDQQHATSARRAERFRARRTGVRAARDDLVDQRRRDRRMQRALMHPLLGDQRRERVDVARRERVGHLARRSRAFPRARSMTRGSRRAYAPSTA